MNHYFCYVNKPSTFAFRENENDNWYFVKRENINDIALGISGTEHDIAKAWSKNIHVSYYNRISFDVDYKNNDNEIYYFEGTRTVNNIRVLNLYKRPYSEYIEDIEIKAKDFFDFLFIVISDKNEEYYEFLLNWFSYLIQNGKTEIALVFKGKTGTGKGTLKLCFGKILSWSYVLVDECGARMGSRFNGHEEGKLLYIMEEVLNKSGEIHSRNNLMKNKITDKDTVIEKKYVEAYTAKNNCSYILITNDQNPCKIERDHERRYVATIVPDTMRQQSEYFVRVQECVDNNVAGLRHYFQTRPCVKPKVIHTEANKDLIYLNECNFDNFMDLEIDNIFKEHNCIDGRDLFEIYNAFCSENPDGRKTMSYRYFIDKIKSLGFHIKNEKSNMSISRTHVLNGNKRNFENGQVSNYIKDNFKRARHF